MPGSDPIGRARQWLSVRAVVLEMLAPEKQQRITIRLGTNPGSPVRAGSNYLLNRMSVRVGRATSDCDLRISRNWWVPVLH